ncbi:MAG: hypothetical protein JO303_11480, partial [Caulobacteraceae bacterium]|nr:hypothetical protein [Caulobacteraceae bacterium]
ILAALSASGPNRPKLVVGFAAETDNLEANARAKLARKGCDWIVANDVADAWVMGGDDNTVAIVEPKRIERWERAPKTEIARRIAQRISDALNGATKAGGATGGGRA